MQFTTTVTQKGQATIPAPIRKRLKIKPNSKIVFVLNDTLASFKPVVNFFSLKGSIKSKKPFDIKAMDDAIKKSFSQRYVKKNH